MINQRKLKIIVLFTVTIAISLTAVTPNRVSGEVQVITEAEEKLEGITEEEKTILETLFTIEQEIEEMEREEVKINNEIDTMQIGIEEFGKLLEERKMDYEDQLEILKKVLVSYQRSGPVSYLDTLLSAGDLKTFVGSINMIRDLSNNVGELLSSLEEEKKILSEEKDKLLESAKLLEVKKEELKEPLARKQDLLKKQEAYLNTLQEEKAHYQEQISDLSLMWEDIKLQFSKMMSEFTRMIEEGNITEEDLNINIQFPKIGGTIYEETFNNLMKEHSNMPELVFHFYKDKVRMEIPEKHLILEGIFAIEGDKSLKLEVASGSFYDMPLEITSIEELFKEGYLLIDFSILGEDMLFDFSLETVVINEGSLEFSIKPKF